MYGSVIDTQEAEIKPAIWNSKPQVYLNDSCSQKDLRPPGPTRGRIQEEE
jgi:hypothetical protein